MAEEPAAGDMKKCKYCGREVGKDTNFCWYCGRELEARPERPDPAEPPSRFSGKWILIAAAAVIVIALAAYWIPLLNR